MARHKLISDKIKLRCITCRITKPGQGSSIAEVPYVMRYDQYCGSVTFIPDPNFPSRTPDQKDYGSRVKKIPDPHPHQSI
jgi:hypothetical protein